MRVYTLEQGKRLVRAARNAIEIFLTSPHYSNSLIEKQLEGFEEKHGVFVTLYTHLPEPVLRGCIGFPQPIDSVKKLLPQAAIAAATEDPRFEPVSKEELDQLIVEVSILSTPEKIKGDAYEIEKSIKIGEDGLIIEYGYHSGLLLPIVAVEEKWNAREFLDNVCIKAGLPTDTWRRPNVSLYRFSTQVFREKEPNGEVEEVDLGKL